MTKIRVEIKMTYYVREYEKGFDTIDDLITFCELGNIVSLKHHGFWGDIEIHFDEYLVITIPSDFSTFWALFTIIDGYNNQYRDINFCFAQRNFLERCFFSSNNGDLELVQYNKNYEVRVICDQKEICLAIYHAIERQEKIIQRLLKTKNVELDRDFLFYWNMNKRTSQKARRTLKRRGWL